MPIPSRFYRWPWKVRVEDEVDEELAFHLEMRTRELQGRGLSERDARREAERRLGNLNRMRASLRDMGARRDEHMKRAQYLGEFGQDVAFSIRQLLKNPVFTAIAVLTLALGIGGTTAIFSVVYAVVLRPLPGAQPDRRYVVGEMFQGAPSNMSVGNYTDAVAGTTAFEGLAAQQFFSYNLADGGVTERVVGARVTANFFDVIGSRPAAGRTFTADEDKPGSNQVVVLSHRLWQQRFGGGDVVGRDIRLNGEPHRVVGVMPQSFDLTTNSEELWTPIAFTAEQKAMHDEHYLDVYGRLKPGMSIERAQAELEAVATRLRHDFPKDSGNLHYSTQPFVEQFVGDYKTRLLVLLAAVSIVLLIACSNVANLLLARGAARAREIAIRTAIGAGSWRIVRQLLTESLVLGVFAAAVGIALAYWTVGAVVAWSPTGVPRLEQARVDPVTLTFAVTLAIGSSILCGLAPALRLSRDEPHRSLHDGRRSATSGGIRDRLRVGLIVAEVALSLMLLVGAGLLIRTAIALHGVNPGFDPTGVLTARIALPALSYPEPTRIVEAFRRLSEEAQHLPGVTHGAVTSYAAMGPGSGSNGLLPEGQVFDLKSLIQSQLRMISPDFFATMRIPIVKGRGFDDNDRTGGQKVMIISEALAARAFPGQDPIGKRISCCERGDNDAPDYKVVVGVAGDVHSRDLARAPRPEFYLPLPQAPREAWNWIQRTMYIVVRTDGDPAALVQPLKAIAARIDPDVPLFDVRLMDQRLQLSLAASRFNTLLLSLLGMVGLTLAATGIYGIVAYLVSQRTQEIGVRMALGATPGQVVILMMKQAMRPVVIGTAIGIAAALATSRVLAGQLFAVKPTDPLTIAVVAATLIVVAFVASVVPARRAAAVDPTRALSAD
ncbi:MAG TPA: ABC transporter permease [Vicinamibacterales bacterium]